jgi:hypothetical protein
LIDLLNDYLTRKEAKRRLLEDMDSISPRLKGMIGIIKLDEEDMKKTNKELIEEAKWEHVRAKCLP